MYLQLEVAILNNIGSNLQFIKNQQWRVSYYTMLAYGATIAIQRNFNLDSMVLKFGLCQLVLLVALASAYLNQKSNDSLAIERNSITKIYEKNKRQVESYEIATVQSKSNPIGFMLLCITIIGGFLTGITIAVYVAKTIM